MSNPWPIEIHPVRFTVQRATTQAERLLCAEWGFGVAYKHIFTESQDIISWK